MRIAESVVAIFGAALFVFSNCAHAVIVSATLPSSRSVQVGKPASFFATMINASGVTAAACRIELNSAIDATLSYQATDSLNVPVGSVNTPVDIGANRAQSFVLQLTANTPVEGADVEFSFVCNNDGPASIVSGLNTLRFSASSTPTPDIVALAATVTADGVTTIPPNGGLAAFAVASINVGSPGTVTVTPRAVGDSPGALFVCETTGGQTCNLAAAVETTIASNATPTFSVFALDSATLVPFDPAGNRLFLDFVQGSAIRGSTSVALKSTFAAEVFADSLSTPVVQTRCINCHVTRGVAGATRLLFQPASAPDNVTANVAVFQTFLEDVPDGANRILNKVQGALAHGGGAQLQSSSQEFADLSTFLGLLGGEVASSGLTAATLFAGVGMIDAEQTLSKAALLLAGRYPTPEETAQIASGSEADLRSALRGLMAGDVFHQFLLESSNDRLLTDRQNGFTVDPQNAKFKDLTDTNHQLLVDQFLGGADPRIHGVWSRRTQFGFGRAPLELIAYVVENDLPYTEILTADYVMANPWAAAAIGDDAVVFADSNDMHEFQPAIIKNYYRDDESKIYADYDLNTQTEVLDWGNLITDFPHAGVLNTMSYLSRYPSTATNRNRARARWTFYHFLGFDIEKSASRTTDPEALADTNNPTLNNPVCTACHATMDPVAGAFQNYGDEGFFRDRYEGLDSLDDFYKYPQDGSASPYYVYGDTWYRDMRTPGLDGKVVPNADTSLQWLAQQIVADPRFAAATVKFWWPALMGVETAEAPEDSGDENFNALLVAANNQAAEVDRLAEGFQAGFNGGPAHNLKDLLVEMILSDWFRAKDSGDADPERLIALQDAGVEKLLTPEQLARKTQTLTGFDWGRYTDPNEGRDISRLQGEYRLYYGGIDSAGVTERAGDMTAIMASVAQAHAMEVSCPIVQKDLYLLPDGQRKLFNGFDLTATPLSQFGQVLDVTADAYPVRTVHSVTGPLLPGSVDVVIDFFEDFYDEATQADRNLYLTRAVVRNSAGQEVQQFDLFSAPVTPCGGPDQGGYAMYGSGCPIQFPLTVAAADDYTIEVEAWAMQAGPEIARMRLNVVATSAAAGTSAGAAQIKIQIAELYRKILGIEVATTSADVERAYQLFAQIWERKVADDPNRGNIWFPGPDTECAWAKDVRYFDGIDDQATYINVDGYREFDWDYLSSTFWPSIDTRDPSYVAQTWVAVLAYMLMDYRYLYL